MTTTVEAIYENGILKLEQPLPLPDKAQVTVTVHAQDGGDDCREEWLKLSEVTLTKTWDNGSDDVFNELLKK